MDEKKLVGLLEEIDDLKNEKADLEKILREEASKLFEKIEEQEKAIKEAQERIEMLRLEIREASPTVVNDIMDATSRIEAATSIAKQAAYEIPTEELAQGKEFSYGNTVMTVSKVTALASYKKEALDEFPELVLLGAVEQTINSELVESLIASDKLSEDVRRYRVMTRAKNPSVSIKERK